MNRLDGKHLGLTNPLVGARQDFVRFQFLNFVEFLYMRIQVDKSVSRRDAIAKREKNATTTAGNLSPQTCL